MQSTEGAKARAEAQRVQEVYNAKMAELDTVSASACVKRDAVIFRGGERKRRCQSDAKLVVLDTVSASVCVKGDAMMFRGEERKRQNKSASMPSLRSRILRVCVCAVLVVLAARICAKCKCMHLQHVLGKKIAGTC